MTRALRQEEGAVSPARAVPASRVAGHVVDLAIGRGGACAEWPWEEIEALAVRECCGPLVWYRSAEAIRRHAPRPVVESLRSHAITTAWRLRLRLDALRGVIATLASVGVRAILHKGMPLSLALYGDAFVRPSADIDLFVGAADRGAARRALLAAGWSRVEGSEPWEEAFVRVDGGVAERVEVHTFALGDLLAHLPRLALRTQGVDVEGVLLDALSTTSHAITLATHLSQHRQAPLLFALDYGTLWTGLQAAEREEARARARACRVEGYVEFASRFAGLIEGDAEVRDGLLRDLGFGEARGHMGHPAWRDVRFARGADRVRVALGWLHPPRVRGAPGGPVRAQLRRLQRLVNRRDEGGSAALAVPAPAVESPGRSLRVAPGDLVALVRDTLAAAPALWIDARGTSMVPAIPTGARVRLTRVDADAVRGGDVVLADLGPAGGVVLHRVLARKGETLVLRGDNCARPDAPASIASIVAVADRLRVGARDFPIPPRARTAGVLDRLRGVRAGLVGRGRQGA